VHIASSPLAYAAGAQRSTPFGVFQTQCSKHKTTVTLLQQTVAAHFTPAYMSCLADTTALPLLLLLLYVQINVCHCAQMHNSRRFLQGSFLGSLIDFEPTHELHTEFGFVSLFGSIVHAGGWVANLIIAGQGTFIYMSQVLLKLNICS
jgi:hypothetical protein